MRFRALVPNVLVVLLIILEPISAEAQPQGADSCAGCHQQQFDDWNDSGHRFILMTGAEAQQRPLPLPGGNSWEDISYLIGGFMTKALYLDSEGFFITQTQDILGQTVNGNNQYNLLTGQWSDYHAGEENKPYSCGRCHTTGWIADDDWETDGTLEDNQGGLPGMLGTFFAAGVECEQCHGTGHPGTIPTMDEEGGCGGCHVRGAAESILASNGFIRNAAQYNEHLAGAHATYDCVRCHDPHKSGELSIKETAECGVSCHESTMQSYSSTPMFVAGVTCADCHMPYATLSAQPLGTHKGDVRTHLFFIESDVNANMFTEDGGLVELDEAGKAAVTLDLVCMRCHQDAPLDELAWFAKDFHLPRNGLSGSVEDTEGQPLSGVGIEVRDSSGERLFQLTTAADGSYRSHSILNGVYYLQTHDEPLGLGRELYDDHVCIPASRCDDPAYVVSNGAPVVVDGSDISGIDFVLEVPIGGMISGRVSDADTEIDLPNILIHLLDESNAWYAETHTDGFGDYYFSGLPDGSYKVIASGNLEGYIEELFGGDHCPDLNCDLTVSGTPILITNGSASPDRDIQLDFGGTRLFGTITRTDTGEPVPSNVAFAGVELISEAGERLGQWPTDSAGQFQIILEEPGNFFLSTLNAPEYHGLINEAWDDIKCLAVCDPLALGADLITVEEGATVIANFSLDPEVVFSDGFE